MPLPFVRTGGRYLERLVSHEATLRILAGLRSWLYQRFEPLAPSGLQYLRSGDVLARMGSDIDRLENAFLRLFVPAAVAVATVLVVVGVATAYLPSFGLVLFAMLLIAGVGIPSIAYRLGRSAGARHTANTARMSVTLVDSLEGLGELKAYGLGDTQRARLLALSDDLIEDEIRLANIGALNRAGAGLFANFAMLGALVLAGAAVAANSFAPADLAMLALLGVASFEALTPIPDAVETMSATMSSARRIFSLADSEPRPAEPETPRPLPDDNTACLRLCVAHLCQCRGTGAGRDRSRSLTGPACRRRGAKRFG